MLAALNKKENLFEVSAQSPPPCKDYIHLSVTMNEVIWIEWRINPHCLRPEIRVSPIQKKETHDDFVHDGEMQNEVKRVFGVNVFNYVYSLCAGNIDYICRISRPVQIYLLSFLQLEDIGRLSQTSKHFNQICNSNELWEHFVERHCNSITEDMRQVALEKGWKSVFFMNKLQIRSEMRRQQQRSLFTPRDNT